MRGCALFVALLCALSGFFATPCALAQTVVNVEAIPVLGAGTPAVDGWAEVYVRLENRTSQSVTGFLELHALTSGKPLRAMSRAPFAVAPKARVSLLLPGHGLTSRAAEVKVRAVDDKGDALGETALPPLRNLDPLVFDLNVPSRIAPVLANQAMPIKRRSIAYGWGNSVLSISTPAVNSSSGELVLPDLAAGYASVTLVLASARILSSLSPPTLDALVSWVSSGGALALALDRPDDMRSPWLESLLGGRVQAAAPTRELGRATQFAVPVDASGKGSFAGGPRLTLESASPSPELAATFSGVRSANLRETPWGASASYGLGEVHVLAWNPDGELAASDRWARLKVVDLVRHAWERGSVVALPHGQAELDEARTANIRRVLDPNESTRWTVIVSTLLLLLYAGLAGPLNFYLAQRARRPLRALMHLPFWAGGALLVIVVLGVLGKGVHGRARHLSLIETGAGMARGPITRFRGLYGSRSDDVRVRASRGSVLDVLGDPEDIVRELVVDRDGLRLENLREKPWQVQVVREDGFVNLAAGVSIVLGSDGELIVKNRAARDLRSVLVKAPGSGLGYFPKIADGESVAVARAKPVGAGPASSASGGHPLSAASFHDLLEGEEHGLAAAWEALESSINSDVDWWPDDVPVLIAELDGGEGRTLDSGLTLDVDRVLIRVVGYGGVP